MSEQIKTVKELLAEAEEKTKKTQVSQLINALGERTLQGRMQWMVCSNGKSITAQLSEDYGVEVEEELLYDGQDEEEVCYGAVYRLSLIVFKTGCSHLLSVEQSVNSAENSLRELYTFARHKVDNPSVDIFEILDRYFESIRKEEALDMLLRIYDCIKSQ